MDYNNSQRVHWNFVEQMPVIIVNLFLGGLFVPTFALIVAILVAVGRIVYTYKYIKEGSDSRFIGVALMAAPLYALALYTYFEIASFMLFSTRP